MSIYAARVLDAWAPSTTTRAIRIERPLPRNVHPVGVGAEGHATQGVPTQGPYLLLGALRGRRTGAEGHATQGVPTQGPHLLLKALSIDGV
jgi:hypothetical protein